MIDRGRYKADIGNRVIDSLSKMVTMVGAAEPIKIYLDSKSGLFCVLL